MHSYRILQALGAFEYVLPWTPTTQLSACSADRFPVLWAVKLVQVRVHDGLAIDVTLSSKQLGYVYVAESCSAPHATIEHK